MGEGGVTGDRWWNNCVMRKTHLPLILSLMPVEVQNGIKTVSKYTHSNKNSTAGVYSWEEKLFLLSEVEVMGSVTYSVAGEGSQYAYYAAGNSKIKTFWYNNQYVNSPWSTRSPSPQNTNKWCHITNQGASSTDVGTTTYGVSFAFCF